MAINPLGVLDAQTIGAIADIAGEAARHGTVDRTLSSNVFVGDISDWSQAFHVAARALDGAGRGFPVVELGDGNFAPLAVGAAGGSRTLPFLSNRQIVADATSTTQEALRVGFQPKDVPIPDARKYFSDGLRDFLTERWKSVVGHQKRQGPGSTIAPTLPVDVFTHGTGLRIFYAPRFWVSLSTVFGNSLSSPVTGQLSPGAYVFGAQDRWGPAKFETAVHRIPPTTTVHMMSV